MIENGPDTADDIAGVEETESNAVGIEMNASVVHVSYENYASTLQKHIHVVEGEVVDAGT